MQKVILLSQSHLLDDLLVRFIRKEVEMNTKYNSFRQILKTIKWIFEIILVISKSDDNNIYKKTAEHIFPPTPVFTEGSCFQ